MKEHIKRITRYNEIRAFYDKYERWFIPTALFIGVAGDFFTFRILNIQSVFLLLTVHMFLAGFTIAYTNFYGVGKVPKTKFTRWLRIVCPPIIQISFGALISASLVFYWFSGALSASWPIMILLIALIVSNETLRDYYQEPVVQVGVYYFAVLSFFVLALPYRLNSISAWVFVLSGLLSLGFIGTYIYSISKFLKRFYVRRKKMYATVAGIFLVMNVFYFGNVIPPIPLSITEAGVYHFVERQGNNYVVRDEERSFLDRVLPGTTIHIEPGSRVYVWSSIFAPANLQTRIVHSWEYYNEEEGEWEERDDLSFGITGGREDGYRGYSRKSRMDAGKWRVDVQTVRGQKLGRVTFHVEHVDETPTLITELK